MVEPTVEYLPDDTVKTTNYYTNGRIHFIAHRERRLHSLRLGVEGYHNDNGPARQLWSPEGILIEESWYKKNRRHRANGPAVRQWANNGVLILEEWWQNGKLHRYYKDPTREAYAQRRWNRAGVLIEECWYRKYNLHRIGGPARRTWNDAGVLIKELWYQGYKLHRLDGPALVQRDNTGALIEEWYRSDHKLTPREIENILRPRAYMAALRTLPQPIFEEIAAEFCVI